MPNYFKTDGTGIAALDLLFQHRRIIRFGMADLQKI